MDRTMRGNTTADYNALENTRNAILRISDKKTMQLIQLYKNEECLWNTLLDDYPNRAKRLAASEKIARTLDIKHFEGKHVLMKFKNLRNSYCQELKKIAQSLATVGSEDSPDMYKPKVQWFPIMDSFIRPHLQAARPALVRNKQRPKHNDTNAKNNVQTCSDSDGQEDWAISAKDSAPETSYTIEDIQETSYSQSEYPSENDELSNDSLVKRRRTSNSSSQSEQFTQNQVFFPSDIASPMASRTEDTFDNFGKYIASLLRSLPPNKALRLQPKIINMIVEVGIDEVSHVKVEINRLGETEFD